MNFKMKKQLFIPVLAGFILTSCQKSFESASNLVVGKSNQNPQEVSNNASAFYVDKSFSDSDMSPGVEYDPVAPNKVYDFGLTGLNQTANKALKIRLVRDPQSTQNDTPTFSGMTAFRLSEIVMDDRDYIVTLVPKTNVVGTFVQPVSLRFDGKTMSFRLRAQISAVPPQSQVPGPSPTPAPTPAPTPEPTPAPANCMFNGVSVVNGGTVTAFQSTSVAFGQTCQSQVRSCANGVLSGTYTAASCTVGAAASCTFNGQTIADNASVNAYQTASVPFGQTCAVQSRVCRNGVLSGTHTFASCSVGVASTCSFNGQTLNNNQAVTAYEALTVPFGQTCKAQTRTCTNGTLSGTFSAATCAVEKAANCTFNGQVVAHGASVAAFLAANVNFGQSCTSQNRICNNGTLSGTYTFATCSPAAGMNCTFNGTTIVHGATTTAYLYQTVQSGQACLSTPRTCNNGILSGSASYQFSQCAVLTPTTDKIQFSYSRSFYDPTISEDSFADFPDSDTIDLGEVPIDETATQTLKLKLKNHNPTVASIQSSGLSKAGLEPNIPAQMSAGQELLFSIKPVSKTIGDINETWSLKVGPRTYSIKVKGRIVP